MLTRGLGGVFLCLLGGVWFGQGIGKIHGSFMTGQSQWTGIGAVTVAVGLALLVSAIRIRGKRAPDKR